MVLKVFNKRIPDDSGSAMQFRIQAREALWGIVDAIQEQARIEDESRAQAAEDEMNDATFLEMHEFNVDGDLPIQFGSKKKRKNNCKEKKPKKTRTDGLNIPPYDGSLIEHNIYRLANRKDLCRVLGNAPSISENSSLVQVLCSDETMIVNRGKDLLALSNAEQYEAASEVTKDIEYRYSRKCPSGVHLKYWDQRYRLFSKYDEGIILDEESWYSVTPERIARHITQRCVQQSITSGVALDTVLDCFSGCGGNTIPFAYCRRVKRVLSVDIDPIKLQALIHNAGVYGAADKIEVVCKDVYSLLESFLHRRTGREDEFFPEEGLVEHLQSKLSKHYQLHGRNSIVIKLQPKVSTNLGSGGHTYFKDDDNDDEDTPGEGDNSGGVLTAEDESSSEETKKVNETSVAAAPASEVVDVSLYPVPDLLVMSPPWGGPEYCNNNIVFDLPTMLPCGDGFYLLLLACAVCRNVVYLLPKNVDDEQLEELKKLVARPMMVENIYLNSSFKVKVVYVGTIFKKP